MHRLLLHSLAVLCLATVLLTQGGVLHAQGDDEARVGITISAVVNASPSVGERVSETLAEALGETLKTRILAGQKAQALLPEEARSETCLGDSACLVNAGKALGVEQLLMLIIVGVGDELKIEATWVDVATGETALRPGITSALGREALLTTFRVHASALLPGVPLRQAPTPTPADPATNTVTEIKEDTPVAVVRKPRKASNGTSKLLMVGGGVVLAGTGGYGLYRLIKCGTDCDPTTGDKIVDSVAIVSGLVLATGLYLYLSGDDDDAETPIAFTLGSDSVGFSLGGSF